MIQKQLFYADDTSTGGTLPELCSYMYIFGVIYFAYVVLVGYQTESTKFC